MASSSRPDLIIVGQVTVDDVVPARPGPWVRQLGGSSLYAAAGARLWLAPERIGLVARLGRGFPFAPEPLLRAAGVSHVALRAFEAEHLIEWLIYEPDGSRRSLPRNAALLGVGGEGSGSAASGYAQALLDFAPTAEEIPAHWLPAAAVHLCPQAGSRHRDSLRTLRGQAGFISVDPSPHYSRKASLAELSAWLSGATALLPSLQEIQSLLDTLGPSRAVLDLQLSGFPEVVLKRGGDPVLLATQGKVSEAPTRPARVVDPTGAGDAFCGAYAACRLLGCEPLEAAKRAIATAALVVQCSGVEAALSLERSVV